jgi:hypothetical protein
MKLLTEKIYYDGIEVTDIFKRFKFLNNFKEDVRFYQSYYVQDNETPEQLAFRFYESVDWWWLILLFNEILDPFYDWPMSQIQTEEWAKKLVPTWETNYSTYYAKLETIIAENETHRKIKILRSAYLNVVIKNIKEFKG